MAQKFQNGSASFIFLFLVPTWLRVIAWSGTYINHLADDLGSHAKLFADDTSLFTVVYDETVAADQLNRDLKVITDWAYQWKMQFNSDINKQAVQVTFS